MRLLISSSWYHIAPTLGTTILGHFVSRMIEIYISLPNSKNTQTPLSFMNVKVLSESQL